MMALALLLAQAAGEDIFARGAAVFRKTCATAYCHGPEGSAGRAPQLAGRRFPRRQLTAVIREGIPNTSMPGFKDQLSSDDLNAVTAYVASLATAAAPATAAGTAPAKPPAPPAAARGRDLFFDPARLPNCGVCHHLDGWGIAVAADLGAVRPSNIAALRQVRPARVKTAQPRDEPPFPAVAVDSARGETRLWDLTAVLPVLRSFRPEEVTLADGSPWSHAAATRLYSDPELEAILAYLRWLPRPR